MPEHHTHTNWQDILPEYIAGTLPEATRHALEDHLASCDECRIAADDWRDIATITRKAAQSRRTQLPPLQIPFSKADAPNGRGIYLPEKPIKENRFMSINPNVIPIPKSKRASSRRPLPLTLVAATTLVLLIAGLLLTTMSRNASFLGAPQDFSVPALVQINSENADDVAPLYTISMGDTVRGLYWSPDGSKFALVPTGIHVTYIIDLNHPDLEARPYAGDFGTWMPNGQQFITLQPDSVLVHSADTGRELARFDYTGRGLQGVQQVDDDRFLVFHSGGFDLVSLMVYGVTETYRDVNNYTFRARDVPLARTGYDLHVYNNSISRLPTRHEVQADDATLSLAPFTNRPIAGFNVTRSTYQATLTDGVTTIWNADSGVQVFQFPEDARPLSNLMVNPDATIAVAREANSDAVHIWDLTEGTRSALLDDGSVPPMLWFETTWYSTNGMYFVTQRRDTLFVWGVVETSRIAREIRLGDVRQVQPITVTPTLVPTETPLASPTFAPTATPFGGSTGEITCPLHVVQAGDTLLSITNQYGVNVDSVRTMNRLMTTEVSVGDILIIPIATCRRPIVPSDGIGTSALAGRDLLPGMSNCLVHVAQAGDTLFNIADQYRVDPVSLATINRLEETLSVVIGDALIIPVGACDPTFDSHAPTAINPMDATATPFPSSPDGQPTVVPPGAAVTTASPIAPMGQPTIPPGRCILTTLQDIDAYNLPDTNGTVFMHLPTGTQVVGRLYTDGWYMVLNMDINRVGWVEESAVRTVGICDDLPAPTPTQ